MPYRKLTCSESRRTIGSHVLKWRKRQMRLSGFDAPRLAHRGESDSQEEERGDEVLERLLCPATDLMPLLIGRDVVGADVVRHLASTATQDRRRVRLRDLMEAEEGVISAGSG